MPVGVYQQLRVWQASMKLVEDVYRMSHELPKEESYGLGQQIRRAAVSVPSNIAEGHAQRSKREYLYFVAVALGSLAELETQLLLVDRLGIAQQTDIGAILASAEEIGRMLRGLESALATRLIGTT